MRSKTRASLIKALSYCSLRELPEVDSGEDVWIKALALVTKTDGRDYFIAIEKDPKTIANRVKKDFGDTGAIVVYKSIHPYLYLSSEYMPKFHDKTKETRIKYLTDVNPEIDWSKYSLKELNDAVLGVAIKAQLNHIKSNFNYTSIEDDRQEYIEAEAGGDEGEVEVE
ncbi:MAG: hypothetical protein UH850_00355 [Paludibacteraceae bacterium]|nr:hypothetical protein [Paludibacteraceae bacterium]